MRDTTAFRQDGTLLYVHIPYCDFFCHFCPLYKTLDRADYEDSQQQRFVAALTREILAYARHLAPGRRLDAVYFGGGTPTALPAPHFRAIADVIRSEFELAPDAEFTTEGIATHFSDPERLGAFVGAGVNRISFGVQSFHPEIRNRLGRRDTMEECFRAVEEARRAGIRDINVDLMYGYPGQNLKMFQFDLQGIRRLAPDSCDFYYYMLIMNTPYRQMIAKARYASPDEEIPLAEMRERLLDEFRDWHQATMECFMRRQAPVPGIWDSTCGGKSGVAELIAVGPTAYGQVSGHYYYNRPDLRSWLKAVEAGLFPIRGKIVLQGEILALRRLFGSILLGTVPKVLYEQLPGSLRRRVRGWLRNGLMEEDENGFRLSRTGRVGFQMLSAECVPPLHAFVMMRTYMLTFPEQRALLFRRTELLYANSIRRMVEGNVRVLKFLRGAGYRLLLCLPDRVLEKLVALVRRALVWRLS